MVFSRVSTGSKSGREGAVRGVWDWKAVAGASCKWELGSAHGQARGKRGQGGGEPGFLSASLPPEPRRAPLSFPVLATSRIRVFPPEEVLLNYGFRDGH